LGLCAALVEGVQAPAICNHQCSVGNGKNPFALASRDGHGFMFAGIWSIWHREDGDELTAAILTRDASGYVSDVHDRMPVIIQPGAWMAWLDPQQDTTQVAAELVANYSVDEATAWAVTRAVNSSRSQGPDLLEPKH
jgi:putative SOS response-associated peptidase YedK